MSDEGGFRVSDAERLMPRQDFYRSGLWQDLMIVGGALALLGATITAIAVAMLVMIT